jgi:hypothetical protein
MFLLLGLALSLGVGPAPAPAVQACTSNISVGVIQVNALQHAPNLVGDTMPIRAIVNSACQIQTVVGEAFGHQVSFTYHAPSGYWGGTFDLTADPHTPFTLTITATDINGTQGVGTRDLIHDLPPVMTITSPVYSAVARPSLQVSVSCADDDPAGCSSVVMSAPQKPGNPTLASGVSGINETVSLAAYEGVGVWVRLVATDSRGQQVASERFVFVESSPHLVEVANAPGAILDDSLDRTLFLAEDIHPSVREKSDGQIVQLATAAYRFSDGRVTDHGAVSLTKLTGDWHFYGWQVVELRDGALTTVADGSHQRLEVKGNYGLVGAALFGDLDAGTWTTVPVSNPTSSSIGPNGDFVYAKNTPRQVFRYRGGVETQLTFSGVASVSPVTDGVNVVYKQVDGSGHTLAIRLITDSGDVLVADLSGFSNYSASPPYDYVTNGGWTAFTKPVGSFKQVWRRAPDGTITQVSFFGSDATIDALSSDGAISIKSQFRYWLASSTGTMQEVSQWHDGFATPNGGHVGTRSFFRDGDLHVAIGASVFKVLPAPEPVCTSNISVGVIQVNAPQYAPNLVGDTMPIRAIVNSTCQIDSVVGEAFGHTVSFAYDPPSGYWGGTFNLAADPHTPFTLTITATDLNGTPGVGTLDLIHDLPPVMTITAPVHSAVARPSLQLSVSCVDDDPAGCSSVVMSAPLAPGMPTLASGVSGLNQTVSLAGYEGVGVWVRFVATDSRGQAVASERFVYVESSPYLVEVANAPGAILDDSPERTLFLADDMNPSVLEKSNAAIVQLSPSAYRILDGRVTDHGALSLTKLTPEVFFDGWRVVELRDGVVTTVAEATRLQVKGDYALVGNQLFGDLNAGTWETVPVGSIANGSGVGPNGDFVYAAGTPRQIFRYRAGVPTQLTSTAVASVSPDTDGVNVAYKQINGAQDTLAIRLVTAGGDDILLADLTGYDNYFASPPHDYVTNGGWTAFTKPVGGFLQVWKRAPDGTISQVSFFGSDATIDALSSDGAVSIRNQHRLWLASPTGAVQEVSQWHNALATPDGGRIGTRSFFRDGDLYVLIGASAFKFVPAPAITAQPSNQTVAFGQTATLSVTVSGTGPFTYQWYVGTSGDTSNPIAGATSSSYTTPPLTSPTRYWVRVTGPTGTVDSADALVTIAFTDDPIVAGVTIIQAVHVTELRTRIDAVRAKYGLAAFAYSEPSITAGVSLVMAQAILELRAALAQAYTAAGQTPPSYVTSPAAGMPVLAADIASLRLAITAIE